jgi:dTDP-4-dehydrorhamnose reductase
MANDLNQRAVERFVDAIEGTDIKFVHVSADYVFNGEKGSPYLETDEPNPRSVDGRSKLMGERVASECKGALIIRVSFMGGPDPSQGRRSFSSWVLSSLKEGKGIRLFTDQ